MADRTIFDRIRPAVTGAIGALMLAAYAAAGIPAQQGGEVVSAGDGGAISPRAIAETRRLGQRSFSPYVNRKFPTEPLWGDQHVHTEWSFDAGFLATVGPEEALQLARGEQVLSTFGVPVRLSRPLDWVVMTDHSDSLGLTAALRAGDPQLLQDPTMKKWSEGMMGNLDQVVATAMGAIQAQSKGSIPEIAKSPAMLQQNREQYTAIIEGYNSPGLFTALIGYEWTPNPGPGNNLHRNLVYRDGKDRADRAMPLTTYDSVDPEDLWQWMGGYEQESGGRILAIPHNGNLSNGLMFALATYTVKPMTKEYAEARSRWEPLYETSQIKGEGETHPSLSPDDEFADYETWDTGNLNLVPKQAGMLQYEYTR